MRTAVLGHDYPLRLRRFLTNWIESHPYRFRGLLHDDAMAYALGIGLNCKYLRIEHTPSPFDNGILQLLAHCAEERTDILVIDLGAIDIGCIGYPAPVVAEKLLSLARYAYRELHFKLVAFVSAIYRVPDEVSFDIMDQRVAELNDCLRDYCARNFRLMFFQLKGFQYLPDRVTPQERAQHLQSDGSLTRRAFRRYRHSIKHCLLKATHRVLKYYPSMRG